MPVPESPMPSSDFYRHQAGPCYTYMQVKHSHHKINKSKKIIIKKKKNVYFFQSFHNNIPYGITTIPSPQKSTPIVVIGYINLAASGCHLQIMKDSSSYPFVHYFISDTDSRNLTGTVFILT